MPDPRTDDAALRRLEELRRGATPGEVLAFFDSLPAVSPEQMLGRWRGSELPTGSPLDGLLEAYGWYGKEFLGPESVHPLLFRGRDGRPRPVDPGLIPVGLLRDHAGLARLWPARTAFDRLREVAVGPESQDAVTNRLHEAYTALRAQLAADFDPHLDTTDGVSVCVVRLAGQLVGATDLERALAKEIEVRRDTLSEDERDVIERHLLTEVGTHLGERMHAAWSLVDRMNEQLTAHPTRSGVSLFLRWEADPAAGPTAADALRLLRRDVNLLTATERATLAAFLAGRVRVGRDATEGADVVERLAAALDYRRWHRFAVHRRGRGGTEQFTARTQAFGSGGEQAKLAHLPLFAAMAGYYGSARPTAPRLLVLDEAFAGIDDDQRGDCMAMLVDLDLDPVLANFGEWGCYPEVPHVAVYHLERAPGQPGVAALRFVWDGRDLREDDPFLDERTALPLDDASLLT